MEQIHNVLNSEDLQEVNQFIQSGALNQVDEKQEGTLKEALINVVTGMQFGRGESKSFSRKAFVRILRRSPDNENLHSYYIPAIMAANFKQTDALLALMLKGGSPSRINPDFLLPFLSRNAEGVSPLLEEIAELESQAHQQGKSFSTYAEEQGHAYSLEEVLGRLESQAGGRKGRKGRKTHKGRKGKKQTRRR